MAISAIAALGSVITQAIVYGAVNWALVATTFVLSALSRALAPKAPTLASQLRDRTETVRTAVAPHKIVYGEVPLSGPLVFAASTGASNEYLHLVIALTGHECEAMTTVWFNDVAVGTLDVDGNVTDGQFSGLARIHYHLGSPAQNADTDLVAECGAQGWTTDHRLQGRGYLYVRLKYDATAYPNGIPNIKVLVKGKKVYDPRTSTTGWSRNWALCVRDYLTATYGLRCAVGDIDDAAITLAANISDEAVPLAVGTQTRYTCDGVLDLSLRPIDHIRAMLSGAAGALVYTQGQYRPFAGAYVTPVVTLTADHLRGTLTVRPRIARKSLFNAVRGTFVDPDKYWQASDFPPMANGTYAAQDGGEEIWADIELPFTIDSIRAQRLAKIHLEKSRQGITIDFPAKLSAVKIAVWDVVRITLDHLGWSAKEFRVTGWKMAADGLGVDLVLQEESAASWSWNAGEATEVDPAPDTNLIGGGIVPVPSNLAVFVGALQQDDATNIYQLYATWTASPDATVVYYEMQHKEITAANYISTILSADTLTAPLLPAASGLAYHVRVRAIRAVGAVSEWIGPISTPIIDPGDVNTPVIFQPPVSLSGRPQIWLAVSGGNNWGGCEVWTSLDGSSYDRLGLITTPARHGTLRASLPGSGANPDTTNTLEVSLHSGELPAATLTDAIELVTLCYVDGELMAYRDSTLAGVGDYDLDYLVRGAWGTAMAAHASGTQFARLDAAVFGYDYPRGLLGKTIYFKFLSFNAYGQARQSLADATAYPYTVATVALDTVTGLALEGVFDTTECRITWDAVEGTYAYTVEVWTGGVLRRSITTSDTRYTYGAEEARSDGGLSRTLTFRVRAEGLVGQSPAWASLVAVNSQMGAPVNARTEAGFGSAVVAADNPGAADYAGTLIWAGDASGFTRDAGHLIYDGPNTATTLKINAGTTKWFSIAHYDVFGQDSLTYSGYISVTALDLGGVPTSASLPGTTYLGDDVLLYTGNGSLYVWDAAASPSATYVRATPQVVADQITSIDLKAISLVVGDILAGDLVMDSYGHVRGGQTDYNTGTGFFLGYSGAAYKFSIGNPSGNNLTWNGSALGITGSFSTGVGAIDRLAITGNSIEFFEAGTSVGTVIPYSGGIAFNIKYIESKRNISSSRVFWMLQAADFSDYAGWFFGGDGVGLVARCSTAGKGPLRLYPSTSASAPTHTADLGTLWVTSAGVLYINTSGGTTWAKVGAQ